MVSSAQLRMHKLPVPQHPPQFTLRPWFSLTLRYFDFGNQITVANLNSVLTTQTGLVPAGGFQNIRMISARFWGALVAQNASTLLQPVTVGVHDLIQTVQGNSAALGSTGIMEVYNDYPDQVNRAKIGFTYSIAQQNVVIQGSSTNTQPLFQTSGFGTGSVALFHILFRNGNSTNPIQFSAESAASQVVINAESNSCGCGNQADSDEEAFSDFNYIQGPHYSGRPLSSRKSGTCRT